MKIVNYESIKDSQLEKRKKLARTFLLYSFCKLSKDEKEKYFDEQMPEVILRTMKLESEEITVGDIKEILKSK